MKKLMSVSLALSCGAFLAGLLAAEPGEPKTVSRLLKVAAVDAKTRRIEVKDAGYEVLWDAKTTKFYHHRSVPLKDLPDGSFLRVLGKRQDNERRREGETRAMMTNIEILGTGAAFEKPAIESKVLGVEWSKGKLVVKDQPYFERQKTLFRLVGVEKAAVYSVEALPPDKVAGAQVLIEGTPRKVTIERGGKELEVTRITASEVHLLELSAEHKKAFQLAWADKKRAQDADAEEKDGDRRPPSRADNR